MLKLELPEDPPQPAQKRLTKSADVFKDISLITYGF